MTVYALFPTHSEFLDTMTAKFEDTYTNLV